MNSQSPSTATYMTGLCQYFALKQPCIGYNTSAERINPCQHAQSDDSIT